MKIYFSCFLAGAVAALSLPHAGWAGFMWDLTPWTFPVLGLALYFLLVHLDHLPPAPNPFFNLRAGALAQAWSFGYFTVGLHWIGNALLIDDNPFWWAWPFAVLGLPLLLSLFWAVVFGLGHRILVGRPRPAQIIFFSSLFMAADLARGTLFTGFPWLGLGMIWTENLVILQVVDTIGLTGLSALTLLWALTLISVVARDLPARGMMPLAMMGVLITCALYGGLKIQTREEKAPDQTLQVVMVQANIPQSERWNPDLWIDHFYAHLARSERPADLSNQPTVIIWPETILAPTFLDAPAVKRAIRDLLATYPRGSVLLSGAFIMHAGPGGRPRYSNSLVAYDQAWKMRHLYDKHHLVPFGEYIPYQDWLPLKPLAGFESLQAGPGPRTLQVGNLPPFRPLICYETIFPYLLWTQPLDEQWILNITNDAWYADSPGPQQHLAMARIRAIERGLPMVRVAVTGPSAAFDSKGQSLTLIKYNHAATHWVQLPIQNQSALSNYMKVGDNPLTLLLIVVFGFGLLWRPRP